MVKVLFVCMGNICRSPTAEGVFQHHLAAQGLEGQMSVDSAGTHGWHAGNPPDPRSVSAARDRGIDISYVRSRKVRPSDFTEFDYILAMDRDNLNDMVDMAVMNDTARVQLFLEFASDIDATDVPDPYYGGESGFDHVLDLIEAASEGLIAHIRARHL
jgi:protein-tyrosine phosphatase